MADQQIINYGAEPNDGTGDPLRDAFIKVDENFANLWAAGPVNTNVTITNNTISVTNTNGNLVLSPNGIGVIQTNNHVVPRTSGVYNLGSPTLTYRTAYIGTGGVTTTGNVTADYFLGDGGLLSNVVGSYSNVDVANFLPTYTGTLAGNGIQLTDNGNTWSISGAVLTAPTGATWVSNVATNDEYINSASNGYLNFSTYDAVSNLATQLHMEHGIVQINILKGVDQTWQFNADGGTEFPGNLTIAGNLLPTGNVSANIGSPTHAFNDIFLANGTIYLGNASISANATALVFSNESGQQTAITGTGTITPYGNSNVATLLASFGSNTVSTTGNITAGYFVGDGSQLTNIDVSQAANVMVDRGSDPSNWNSLTQMGIYKVNRDSWSGVTGAPIDSSVYVGILQVNTSGDATTQLFYPGTVGPPTDVRIQWNRSLWNSTWSDWIRIVNNGQTIDAGTY